MTKIFGIGNILLCDDAIGVRIAEKLKPYLINQFKDIKIILGETDSLYCLNCIEPDDKVIIIDSTYFGQIPGTISLFSLNACDQFLQFPFLAHNITFLSMLRQEYPNINGYFIGIEAGIIDFSLNLSPFLENQFSELCSKVLSLIYQLI